MKKNKNSTIIIAILAVVVILVLGYFVYNKFFKKDNTGTKNNETVKDENKNDQKEVGQILDIGSDFVLNLYNKVSLPGDSYYKYWFYGENDNYQVSKADEHSKMGLVYINLQKEDFTALPSNSQLSTNLTLNGNNYTLETYGNSSFISYDKVEAVYKDLFGSTKTLDKKEPLPTSALITAYYIYDARVNGYVLYTTPAGGTSSNYYHGMLLKANQTKDEVIIAEKVTYTEVDINGTATVKSEAIYNYTFKTTDGENYFLVSRVKSN